MSSEIHAESAAQVNILSYAASSSYYYSSETAIYLPALSGKTAPTTIRCQGYGCYHLQLYSPNGLPDLAFELNGCGACSQNYYCYAD